MEPSDHVSTALIPLDWKTEIIKIFVSSVPCQIEIFYSLFVDVLCYPTSSVKFLQLVMSHHGGFQIIGFHVPLKSPQLSNYLTKTEDECGIATISLPSTYVKITPCIIVTIMAQENFNIKNQEETNVE